MRCSEARVEAIRAACESGTASLGALAAVANQVIDDMEDKASVVDAQLLARLCLVREEIGVAAAKLPSQQQEELAETQRTHGKLLPQGTLAFIKELLPVSSAEKRWDCPEILLACLAYFLPVSCALQGRA
jgi:hypothetical protein